MISAVAVYRVMPLPSKSIMLCISVRGSKGEDAERGEEGKGAEGEGGEARGGWGQRLVQARGQGHLPWCQCVCKRCRLVWW